MKRNPNPYDPPDPSTAAGRAETAVAAAERAVAAAELDPAHRDSADGILGEALAALSRYVASIESVQAHARHIELTTGRRDPAQAELARKANKTWRRAAAHLEVLGIRFRRADRRFIAPVNPPSLFQRLIDKVFP